MKKVMFLISLATVPANAVEINKFSSTSVGDFHKKSLQKIEINDSMKQNLTNQKTKSNIQQNQRALQNDNLSDNKITKKNLIPFKYDKTINWGDIFDSDDSDGFYEVSDFSINQFQKALRQNDAEKIAPSNNIKENTDINLQNKPSDPQKDKFWSDLKQNRIKSVRSILADNVQLINEKNEDGDTPLLFAVKTENKNMCIVLLGFRNIDVNIQDKGKKTTLIIALENGFKDIAEFILGRENKEVSYRNKALRLSVEKGYTNIVKTLINDANINSKNPEGNAPIILALKNKKTGMVMYLIEKGADINITNKERETPLLISLQNKNSDIAKLLIEKGADVNAKDKTGNSPLLLALKNSDFDTAWLLTKKNANFDDIESRLKEDKEREMFKSLQLFKQAFTKGNVNVQNELGETAVAQAAKDNHKNILEQLISIGADLNIPNNNGNTPLLLAIKNGHTRIVNLIIKKSDIDINHKNKDGETAFGIALRTEQASIINSLLKKYKITINEKNWDYVQN